jgi:hypothetical protein
MQARRRVRLIHWNAGEAAERAELLRAAGFAVAHAQITSAADLSGFRVDPPDVVVIDLSRLPMQGRDFALAIRSYASLLHVPIVFVGGQQEKVGLVRDRLPDAVYADWPGIGEAVREALARSSEGPARRRGRMDGYADVPLAKKLGIGSGVVIAVVDAPEGNDWLLEAAAEATVVGPGERCDVVLWFVWTRADLDARIAEYGALARATWVLWPKRTSGVPTDLTQTVVREAGLAAGLVDYKIASINATWSGLKFSRRGGKARRG